MHTAVVAELLTKPYKLDGALHDAPEACVSDTPTPWKTATARYREGMILARIYRDLGVTEPDEDAHAAVKYADAQALAAEAHVLGHPAADEYWPNPGKKAMKLTEKYLALTENFMRPENAGQFYEKLVAECLIHCKRLVSVP